MNVAPTHTLNDRLSLTLEGLCRAVAARIAGMAMSAAMIVLVWQLVRRTERRILGLLARFRAGRLVVGVGGVRRGSVSGRVPRPVAARLPRRFGWLLPLVPHDAAGFAGQLRGVLAEAEMVALLAAAPQARRVLAPLCRMLGIEPEVLTPRVVQTAPGSDGTPDDAPAGVAGMVALCPWVGPPPVLLDAPDESLPGRCRPGWA